MKKILQLLLKFFFNKKFVSVAFFIMTMLILICDVALCYFSIDILERYFKIKNFLGINYQISPLVLTIFIRLLLSSIKYCIMRNNELDDYCMMLRNFFIKLPNNKGFIEQYSKSEIKNASLKSSSELNQINFDVNTFYFGFLDSLSRGAILMISIFCIIKIKNFNSWYIMLFAASCLSIILISAARNLFYKSEHDVVVDASEKFINDVGGNVIDFAKDNIKELNDQNSSVFKQFIILINLQLWKFFNRSRMDLIKKTYPLFVMKLTNILCGIGFIFVVYKNNSFELFANNNKLSIFFILANMYFIYDICRIIYLCFINKINANTLKQKLNILFLETKKPDDSKIISKIEKIEFKEVQLIIKKNQEVYNLLPKITFNLNQKTSIIFVFNDKNDQYARLPHYINYKDFQIKTGNILVNGISFHDINIQDFENNKFHYIFGGNLNENQTIKDALIVHNLEASSELINQSLKIAKLYDFIESLSLKNQTFIKDAKMTKEQKFQLSLASHLLSDAQILIMNMLDIDEERNDIKSIKSLLIEALADRILIILSKSTYAVDKVTQVMFIQLGLNSVSFVGKHSDLIYKKEYSDFYLQNQSCGKYLEENEDAEFNGT